MNSGFDRSMKRFSAFVASVALALGMVLFVAPLRAYAVDVPFEINATTQSADAVGISVAPGETFTITIINNIGQRISIVSESGNDNLQLSEGLETIIEIGGSKAFPFTAPQQTGQIPMTLSYRYADIAGDVTPFANVNVTVSSSENTTPTDGSSFNGFGFGASGHDHFFEWRILREPTETADGEGAFVCKYCGQTIHSQPISGYGVFQTKSAQMIRDAAQGATVEISTRRWISFRKQVFEALAQRPDVTVKVSFLSEEYKGMPLSFTIPAGTDAMSLPDANGYAGFYHLGGLFGLQ
ncbi:MAG: hypothetical protein IJQ21_13440 [Lachnospiraceae bacterium]|nr:hypothetical protein [Lachnospiraceae bacterium]